MPVRFTIHSCVVSIPKSLARSSFVTTRGGTYIPVPVIIALSMQSPQVVYQEAAVTPRATARNVRSPIRMALFARGDNVERGGDGRQCAIFARVASDERGFGLGVRSPAVARVHARLG
jgi:hypothetical protein